MRVLIVANYIQDHFSVFVREQAEAVKNLGVEIEYFGVVGKGKWKYLKNFPALKKKIKEYKPDLIHAHYGLSGFFANMQREIPVITTYHGSDIHSGGWVLKLSQLTMHLSAFNIFVSTKMCELSKYKKNNICIQSCGLDLNTIIQIPREKARKELGYGKNQRIGLFSGSFNNHIKNYPLAKSAIELLPDVQLIQLKGFSRYEVCLLMNACDFLLITSYRESGPLVVKEAMACGTPVVSVDVGDVKEIFGNTEGCYIAERNAGDIADKIRMAMAFNGKTNGRQRIIDLGLSNDLVARKIKNIYEMLINLS